MTVESDIRVTVEVEPAEAERRTVVEGLFGHNASRTGDAGYERLTLFLRDAAGEVVGGLLGEIYWGWLHVDVLWVDARFRRRGLGARLLAAAEREAVAKGCSAAFLDTFSFQAPAFYDRLGYEVFGRLEDCPPGHTRFFMRKRLAEMSSGDDPTAKTETG